MEIIQLQLHLSVVDVIAITLAMLYHSSCILLPVSSLVLVQVVLSSDQCGFDRESMFCHLTKHLASLSNERNVFVVSMFGDFVCVCMCVCMCARAEQWHSKKCTHYCWQTGDRERVARNELFPPLHLFFHSLSYIVLRSFRVCFICVFDSADLFCVCVFFFFLSSVCNFMSPDLFAVLECLFIKLAVRSASYDACLTCVFHNFENES